MIDKDEAIRKLSETIKHQEVTIEKLIRELKIKDTNLMIEGMVNKEFMDAVYEGRVERKRNTPVFNIPYDCRVDIEKRKIEQRGRKSSLRSEMIPKILHVLSLHTDGLHVDEIHQHVIDQCGENYNFSTFRNVVSSMASHCMIISDSLGKGYCTVYRSLDKKDNEV